MKNNFPLWLSPVSIGAGIVMVNVSNMTIPYTPPDASLNTLLTGELFVPAQVPIPGASLIKGMGYGAVGLGLAQLAAYAFAGQGGESKSEMPLALTQEPTTAAAPPPPPPSPPPVEVTQIPLDPEPPAIPSPLLPLGIVSDLVVALTGEASSQHVAIASPSQGGKSYTLRGIIWGIEQIDPSALVRIVDGKNSQAGWLGLEKIPGRVKLAHQNLQPAFEAIDEAIALLDSAIAKGNIASKAYFIFDEWNLILDRARQLDASMSGTPGWKALYPDLLYKMGRLVVQGLEHGIHLILTVRSCRCEEFGFSPQLSENFAIAALANQGDYEMFSNLLESPHRVSHGTRRQKLAEEAQEAIVRSQNAKCPLLMTGTNRGRVEEVPDLEWLDWVDLSAFSEAQPMEETAPTPTKAMELQMTQTPQWNTISRAISREEGPVSIEGQAVPQSPLPPQTLPESAIVEREYTIRRETLLVNLPDRREDDLFDRVQEAVAGGETSASRLIKSVVKCTHSQKYRAVGKPALKSQVRKYGSTDFVEQFQSYLDK